jgi:tetratricopeptide (TPR) repeat protein
MTKKKKKRLVPFKPFTSTGLDPRQQGLRAFQAGRLDQAIAAWSGLAKNDSKVLAALAEAYFRRALIALAPRDRLRDLQQAHSLAPEDLRYQYHLALEQHRTGDLPAAIQRYRVVLMRSPQWAGAGMALALAALEQDPGTDLAALPGSTPQLCAVLQPVQALLHGTAPNPPSDRPFDRLWKGLGGLVAGGEEAVARAREALDDPRPLSSTRAVAVRRYYKGLAAARTGDMEAAQKVWEQAYQASGPSPGDWLAQNLATLFLQCIESQLEAGDQGAAVVSARHAQKLALANTALYEAMIRAFDQAARVAAVGGDWGRASGLWESARQVVSSGAGLGSPRPLLHNLALAYEAQERWLDAAEAWRVMLRTHPRHPGRPASASQKAAEEARPGEMGEEQWAWVRRRVIECYTKGGAQARAVAVFRQAVKAEPDNLDTRLELVEALLANDQEQAALNELDRILHIDPQHDEARLRLAALHAAREEWHAAERLLSEVLSQYPDREDVRRQLAQVLLGRGGMQHNYGQHEAARQTFEEGRQYAPKDYRFPLRLARVAIDQGKVDHAREPLEQTLALGADRPEVYIDVVQCWAVAGKVDEARVVIARAEESLPSMQDFYIHLGVMLLTLNTRQEIPLPPIFGRKGPNRPTPKGEDPWLQMGTEALQRVQARWPQDAGARFHIASELLHDRPELALSYAEEGIRLAPDNMDGLSLLGLLQALNNRQREAKETLRRAASLARQKGDIAKVKDIEELRRLADSPMLRFALQFDHLFEELGFDLNME